MTLKKDGTPQRYNGNSHGLGGVIEASYLTPELIEAVAERVRLGTPVRVACEESGIPRSTAIKWLNRGGMTLVANDGRVGVSKDFIPPEHAREPFRSFVVAITYAQGSAHGQLVRRTYQAALQDGDLGLKYLKSVSPEEFAPAPRGNPNLISVSNNVQLGEQGADGRAVGPPIGRVSFEDWERMQAVRARNESEADVTDAEWKETTNGDTRQGPSALTPATPEQE